MRDPDLLNKPTITPDKTDVIVINNLPEYDIEDYDLMDEKDFNKFIQDIKRACRNSFEYKELVKYLRENVEMNKCSFYKNVNNINTFKIKIHIHHEPFSIEDIIRIVVNKRISLNECLYIESCCKEVMYLHYNMMVGLIPLAETPHELVHNKYLFVPLDAVYGNYKDFINRYEPYMETEHLVTLDSMIEATKKYRGEDTAILNRQFVYIDATGAYDLPRLEDIQSLMKETMNNLAQELDPFANMSKPTKDKICPVVIKNDSNI